MPMLSKAGLALRVWLEEPLTGLNGPTWNKRLTLNTAQTTTSLVIPNRVCRTPPVILHLLVLLKKEKKKKEATLFKSTKS